MKQRLGLCSYALHESLPVRGRGLKHGYLLAIGAKPASLPVRGRGLKPHGYQHRGWCPGRSPCGGVD